MTSRNRGAKELLMQDDNDSAATKRWRNRHGSTVLGVVLGALFALVLVIQGAC